MNPNDPNKPPNMQNLDNLLDQPMSFAERQQLGHNIHFLTKE